MKTILLFILLFFSYTSVLYAQSFDQQKHDALKEKLSGKVPKITRNGGKILLKITDLYTSDKEEEALTYINQLNVEKLNNVEIRGIDQYLAAFLSNKNEYPEAIEAYLRVLENPTVTFNQYKQITYVIGQLYFSINQHEKALEYFEEHLAIEPSHTWTQYKTIINIYMLQKKYDKSLDYIEFAETSQHSRFENYNENQKIRFQDRNDRYLEEIDATKDMISRALNGEDITSEIAAKNPPAKNNQKDECCGDYKFVYHSNPTYPAKAVKDKIEGYVLMQFDITKEGKAKNGQVIESSNKVFEESALNSLSGHQFEILSNANDNGELIDIRIRTEFKIGN